MLLQTTDNTTLEETLLLPFTKQDKTSLQYRTDTGRDEISGTLVNREVKAKKNLVQLAN